MNDDMRDLLTRTCHRALRFLESLPGREAGASRNADALAHDLGGALPRTGLPVEDILARLDEVGSQGVVASAGPRYFGFVTGGALPADSCRKLARRGVGSERLQRGELAPRRRNRASGDALGARSARLAGGLRSCVRDRCDDGQLHRPRRRAARSPAGARP